MRFIEGGSRFWGKYPAGLLLIPLFVSPVVLFGPWIGTTVFFLAGCFAGKERTVFLAGENRARTLVLPMVLLLVNAVLLWLALPGMLPRTGVFENVSLAELILELETAPFGVIPRLLGAVFFLPSPRPITTACPFLYLAGYCVTLLWFLPGTRRAAYRMAALLPLTLAGIIVAEGREFYEKRIVELDRRAAVQAAIDARPAPFDLGLSRGVYSSDPVRLKSPPSFVVTAPPAPVLGFSAPLRRLAMSFARTCITLPDGGNKNLFATPGSSSDSPVHLLLGTVNARADIVLVVGEDADEVLLTAEKGKDLTMTAIGRDGLVFFTYADNPVNNITSEQARAVYSGIITNWRELGGNDVPIKPFQHTDAGYAQNRALRAFMGERPVMEPNRQPYVKIDSAGFRNEWVDAAEYDNTPGALGYALRVSLMHPDGPPSGIKALSLGGAAPTPENIRNGTYPAILPVLAITLREDAATPKIRGYIDWMLSSQGQQLLEECGLAPAIQ